MEFANLLLVSNSLRVDISCIRLPAHPGTAMLLAIRILCSTILVTRSKSLSIAPQQAMVCLIVLAVASAVQAPVQPMPVQATVVAATPVQATVVTAQVA